MGKLIYIIIAVFVSVVVAYIVIKQDLKKNLVFKFSKIKLENFKLITVLSVENKSFFGNIVLNNITINVLDNLGENYASFNIDKLVINKGVNEGIELITNITNINLFNLIENFDVIVKFSKFGMFFNLKFDKSDFKDE